MKAKKINTVKELFLREEREALTSDEITFLQQRGVRDLDNKQLLMIFPKDDESTAEKVRGIAAKLLWPIVKFVRTIIDFPEGYVKPVRPEQVVKSSLRNDNSKCVTTTSLTQVTKLGEQADDEVVRQVEAEGIPDGTYRMAFPSIWDIPDDDDESEAMILRNAFTKITGKRL